MRKGFTLIELLIVVVIIGILAVAFVPSMLDAPLKANDKARVKDIQEIAAWISLNKVVPATSGCFNVAKFPTFKEADFHGRLPIDPRGTASINYYSATYTCPAGEYYVRLNPAGTTGSITIATGTYRYGIMAATETKEGANTSCLGALYGIIDSSIVPATTPVANRNWCYAVLIK